MALAGFLGLHTGSTLDASGTWVTPENSEGNSFVIVFDGSRPVDFTCTEQDSVLREVSFRYESSGQTTIIPNRRDQMLLSALSFACTQDGFGFFCPARRELIETIQSSPFADFEFSENGVRVVCDVEYTGYVYPGGQSADLVFLPVGASGSFSMYFSIAIDG